jgi:acyl carrier protein phosphodiesterase
LNYISHIQLASHTQTSLVGSFLGDFVKGRDLSLFTEAEKLGILLHRKVDSFTDQHEQLRVIKGLFPSHLRRYSGIALDIYFDHLLMSNWSCFSVVDNTDLFDHFYQELKLTCYDSNQPYTKVKKTLIEEKWLSNYQQELACLNAMKSIERRFRHSAVFAEDAYTLLQKNRETVEQCFDLFYPELMKASEDLKNGLLINKV